MQKILVTNNINLIDKNYDIIYTDSPYILEKFKDAIYLDTFLDKKYFSQIAIIQKKGFDIDKKIVDTFFKNYANRNIDLINIREQYTLIFKKIFILLKLLDKHLDDEITIAITTDELYQNTYDPYSKLPFKIIERYTNIYYWIVQKLQIKNVNLVYKNKVYKDLLLLDKPIDSLFLRLVNLDKKTLTFNILKKFSLISKRKDKIFVYKKSNAIREIEPYLYDGGFSLVSMPDVNYGYKHIDNILNDEKIKNVIDPFFEDNNLEKVFKILLIDVYKKIIKYYLEQEINTKNYISKLDKSIKFILTNTISGFDSLIFAKLLQDKGYKIINVMHYFSMSYTNRNDNLEINECSAPNMTLCINGSEKKMFETFDKNSLVYSISSTQDSKLNRLEKFQRKIVNKKLNISDKINVIYPSLYWPLNNAFIEGIDAPDIYNFNFEKKIIKVLSSINKRAIYKRYPRNNYVGKNSVNQYASEFSNIKVIKDTYDFRYLSCLGDIFILGGIGYRSTLTWMLKYNKPIIYLDTDNYRLLNHNAKELVKKFFITIDIDKDDWESNLKYLLNKPYKEIMEIWKSKQIHRDKYDDEWLIGMKLHAGKLGAKYIKKFINDETNT